MAVGINTILGWCRVAKIHRGEVANMLMPGGLDELPVFSTDKVKEAVKSSTRLPANPVKEAVKSFARLPANPFMLSPHRMKPRIIVLR
jgi:hypothetical protein